MIEVYYITWRRPLHSEAIRSLHINNLYILKYMSYPRLSKPQNYMPETPKMRVCHIPVTTNDFSSCDNQTFMVVYCWIFLNLKGLDCILSILISIINVKLNSN